MDLPTATAAAPAETSANPPEKLVCKYLKTTGSRLEQKRVCATKRQWDVAEQEMQEEIRDLQSRSMLSSEIPESPSPGGGGPRIP